jgi:hypothetical protein
MIFRAATLVVEMKAPNYWTTFPNLRIVVAEKPVS